MSTSRLQERLVIATTPDSDEERYWKQLLEDIDEEDADQIEEA